MDADQIAERLRAFEDLCRRSGMAVTVQRRVVLEAILRHKDHPTADQVVEAARERLPGVSRATVYRALDVLVDLGVIRRLHHPGPVARFDGRIGRHHHLICTRCDKVIDLQSAPLNKLTLPEVAVEGFEIEDFSIQFTGTCAACRRGAKQRKRGRSPR